jgi:hypothetical protein
LDEEKVARQTAEQSLWTFDEARAGLAWHLEVVHVSLTATTNNLASKSSTDDFAVVQEKKIEIQLKAAEEKLKVDKEKMKTQG